LANITICPVFPILVNNTPGAYKYHATVWDVLMVIGVTLLVVIISSGHLAYKAAVKNPVEALRYE
jgi:ABC-type lipoprotein release transport system permease subunit